MKKILVTVFLAFLFHNLLLAQLQSVSPEKIVKKPKAVLKQLPYRKPFPLDTVARFIKKFGKDSLVHLIDIRIAKSEIYIADSIKNINVRRGDLPIVELMLLVQHFKLDANLFSFDTSKYNNYFYNLYDVYNGNITQMSKVLDGYRLENAKLDDSLLTLDFSNEYIQRVVITFCNKFSIPEKFYEKLYASTKPKNLEYKIHMYWNFIALGLSYKSDSALIKKYRTQLFEELYPNNNLKRDFTDLKIDNQKKIVLKDSSVAMISDVVPAYLDYLSFTENHNAVRMLAYALYANDINLKKYAYNLMYLLDAQQSDGSWNASIRYGNNFIETSYTIYGLWSLLEWKSKLLQNK